MLYISKAGHVECSWIRVEICKNIERGIMKEVNGIVVHQTAAAKISSTFNSYANPGAHGAHFLIDKTGEIYQTASLYKVTNHVGYLQSRCVVTTKCSQTELKHALILEKLSPRDVMAKAVHASEKPKLFPDRYPSNADSIGIEIVGDAIGPKNKEIFEPVTDMQNSSLQWLIKELTQTLGVSMQEIYRHPRVGRKNETEASTAKW